MCSILGLHFIRLITGNGNCLFRSFSYIITGSEDQHLAIHLIIVNHISTIAHLLLGTHIPNRYDPVEGHISDAKMDQDSTWGTEVEMFTLAHLLNTATFLYNTRDKRWWRFSPYCVDRTSTDDDTARAIINCRPNRLAVPPLLN